MREKVFREALDAAARLADLRGVHSEADFHEHVAAALAHLLPGEWVASERYRFNPFGPPEQLVQYQAGTVVEAVTPELYESFKPRVHQHAFFADALRVPHDARLGQNNPSKIITMDAFERRGRNFQHMGIYQDFYRHLDITHQTSLTFKLAENESLMITFSSDRPFKQEHKQVLELIGQHAQIAWQTYEWIAATAGRVDDSQLTADALKQRFSLTLRRAQVLAGIVEGKTNKQIAHSLGLSLGTIRKHVELLLADLNVASRHAAAVLAHQSSPPPEASCDLTSEP